MALALLCTPRIVMALDVAIVNVGLHAVRVDAGLRQRALRWVAVGPSTVSLFCGTAILLGAFPRLGSSSPSPLVPGSALRNHTMVASGLVTFLLFGSVFAFIFLTCFCRNTGLDIRDKSKRRRTQCCLRTRTP